VLAHARGVPLTIIAPGVTMQPAVHYSGVIVPKDSPIRVARDLNGKTVSVPGLKDLAWLTALAWVDKNGGDSKQVSFVEEPVTSVGIGLDSGRLAAAFIQIPALSEDVATGRYRILGQPIDAIYNRMMTSSWVADSNWAAKNPDIVRRFGEVLAKAPPMPTAITQRRLG